VNFGKREKKMWPVAILLIAVLMFYWLAACITIIAWLKALYHVCFGHFIRASIWFALGCGGLFWWTDADDWNTWLHSSAMIVGMGATATLLRFLNRTLPPHKKPFRLHRSGYKEPANDNQLITFSVHVKND
jgi:hypothetical protein